MQFSLLLVDDDAEYADLLRRLLASSGHRVSSARNGFIAMDMVSRETFDLILLDVTMPGMDGFSVLHRLRKIAHTPVIMLTSRIGAADRVQGLDSGADDYICKPCDPDELLSRIRAVMRRTQGNVPAASTFAFGEHVFDANARSLTRGHEPVRLTSLEAELLSMLLQAHGKVVSRESISIALQERKLDAFDRSLDVHISRLRSKLGGDGAMIQTVRGIGYFIAVQAVGD